VQTLATRRQRLEASTIRLNVPAGKSGSIRPPMTTSVSSTASSSDAAAVRDHPLVSRDDMDPIGGMADLAIGRLERGGRTGEVEHLEPWRNVEADRFHGRIIGKFDL
jgi:hypothetical protein